MFGGMQECDRSEHNWCVGFSKTTSSNEDGPLQGSDDPHPTAPVPRGPSQAFRCKLGAQQKHYDLVFDGVFRGAIRCLLRALSESDLQAAHKIDHSVLSSTK